MNKTLQKAMQEVLSKPAEEVKDEISLDEDLSKLSTAEYLARVTVSKVFKTPKTGALLDIQKLAGEDVDKKEVNGKVTLEVLLKNVEVGDDKD